MGLVLFFFLLLPLPAQALTLQDLVDQGSFSAGDAFFSNFRASTDAPGGSPACCTFSTLDDIQAELLPEGFKLSEIQGQGRTNNIFTNRLPSDFHVRLAFDSTRPVRLSDVTLGGAWSPFTTAAFTYTFSNPSTYHVTASLGIQISPHCSHTQAPLFPCDFFFHEGTVTVNTFVPEPSTAALMVAGVAGLAMLRHSGRKQKDHQ